MELKAGNSKNNRLANTKERDSSTGLDNHGFRYYDASIGRYISNDPIGYEGGFNLYVHCTNDPVNKFDPLGLNEKETWLTNASKSLKETRIQLGIRSREVLGRSPYLTKAMLITPNTTAIQGESVSTKAYMWIAGAQQETTRVAGLLTTQLREANAEAIGIHLLIGGLHGLERDLAGADNSISSLSELSSIASNPEAIKGYLLRNFNNALENRNISIEDILKQAINGPSALERAQEYIKNADNIYVMTELAGEDAYGLIKDSLISAIKDSAAKAISPEGGQSPQERGRESEKRILESMGETKNTETVSRAEGNSVPDYVNDNAVGEIKDTQRVTDSKQLRIQREAAKDEGKAHEVVTGTETKVSKKVEDQSKVIRRDDLGPQKPKDKEK